MNTQTTCPEAENHGNPFRYCPVKGCGWSKAADEAPAPINAADRRPNETEDKAMLDRLKMCTHEFAPDGHTSVVQYTADAMTTSAVDLLDWLLNGDEQ